MPGFAQVEVPLLRRHPCQDSARGPSPSACNRGAAPAAGGSASERRGSGRGQGGLWLRIWPSGPAQTGERSGRRGPAGRQRHAVVCWHMHAGWRAPLARRGTAVAGRGPGATRDASAKRPGLGFCPPRRQTRHVATRRRQPHQQSAHTKLAAPHAASDRQNDALDHHRPRRRFRGTRPSASWRRLKEYTSRLWAARGPRQRCAAGEARRVASPGRCVAHRIGPGRG